MESVSSKSVIAEHEIIYKNDKPYIILALKEYERLVHSNETINAAAIPKNKKEYIHLNNVCIVRKGKGITGKDLAKLKLAGLWKDRKDIVDSVEFVQNLRKRATRPHIREMLKNF